MNHSPAAVQQHIMQYLTLLDKCTQIIREDRIWLRNQIKVNNQDALSLFKGLPKIPNMKEFQIKIRKYIHRTKEREKQQQIQRFKENMNLPDFIDAASSERKYFENTLNPPTSSKFRGPLQQNDNNPSKSSFVAKWNQYSHHGQVSTTQYPHANNFLQNRSQVSLLSQTEKNPQNRSFQSSLKKEWSNSYKPHSFNKNLNGQLKNKLSTKNKSLSNITQKPGSLYSGLYSQNNHSRDKLASFNPVKSQQPDYFAMTNSFNNLNSRNSSKNLKQLQTKIHEELKQFHNKQPKNNSKFSQIINKPSSKHNLSEKSLEKQSLLKSQVPIFQEKPLSSFFKSKANIDDLLKHKLGNYDYETYKKQRSFIAQNQQDPIFSNSKNKFHQFHDFNKKLYNQGLFPSIEEQTERDSESQRYPQEPLRFGLNPPKPETDDHHKFIFNSFAKTSPQPLIQSFNGLQASFQNLNNEKHEKVSEFNENLRLLEPVQQIQINHLNGMQFIGKPSFENFSLEPYKNSIPQSLYQSAEKKKNPGSPSSDFVGSNLHKSIIQSIRKSQQAYPTSLFSSVSGYEPQQSEIKEFNQFKPTSNEQNFSSNLVGPFASSNSFSSMTNTFTNNTSNNSDSLFTSPDLLNQCRNFLKKTQQINFENSGVGDYKSSILNSKYESPIHSQQKQFNFSNSNKFPQPITITQSITKDYYQQSSQSLKKFNNNLQQTHLEFQQFYQPSSFVNSIQKSDKLNANSFKKSEYLQSQQKNKYDNPPTYSLMSSFEMLNSSYKKTDDNKHPPQYHCDMVENSSQKTYKNSAIKQVVQPVDSSVHLTSEFDEENGEKRFIHKSKQELSKLSSSIELQDILDVLLQANQGNVDIEATWLKHTLENHMFFNSNVGEILKNYLKKYIQTIPGTQFNFIDIAETLYLAYNQEIPQYKPKKEKPYDIYCLLDFEQKGYINQADIKTFIQHLQQAEVENLNEIRDNLYEVFEFADLANKKRIGYVNLYTIKNEEIFEKLCEDLQQFEFEIQI